jgi:hypothetical protein
MNIIQQFTEPNNLQLIWDIVLTEVSLENNSKEQLTLYFNNFISQFLNNVKQQNLSSFKLLDLNKLFLSNIVKALKYMPISTTPLIKDVPILQEHTNMIIEKTLKERELFMPQLPPPPPSQKPYGQNNFVKIKINEDINIDLPIQELDDDDKYNGDNFNKKEVSWDDNIQCEIIENDDIHREYNTINFNSNVKHIQNEQLEILNNEIAEINKNIKQLLLLLSPVLQSINKHKIS